MRLSQVIWLALWPLFAGDALAQAIDTAKLSAAFKQDVSFMLKAAPKSAVAVVYGNEKVGFFKVRAQANQKQVKASLLPPTFVDPVQFFVEQNGTLTSVGAKRFTSPLPEPFRNLQKIDIKGSFTSPFFLVNGSLPKACFNRRDCSGRNAKKVKDRFTFAMVINRMGEIVWMHAPTRGGEALQQYLAVKPLGDGRYGFLSDKKTGHFSIASSAGKELLNLNSRETDPPFPMHHDFIVLGQDKILTIGNAAMRLKKNLKTNPTWRSYLVNVILTVDLKKETARTVYNPGETYPAETTKFWTGDPEDDKKFVTWGAPQADFDYLHINALTKVQNDGFLVGLRNINVLAFYASDFKTRHWTLGIDEGHDYVVRASEEQFFQFHTPELINEGTVLLFDNGLKTKRSRAVIYSLDKAKGSAKLIWEFAPKPKLFSRNRGSATSLPTGNILAYFVAPNRQQKDHLIEVDRTTGQEVAHLTIDFETLSPGYRAVPLTVFGTETYFGPRIDGRLLSKN